MRTKLLLVIALSIGAHSDLRADEYPIAGVWAAVDQPTRIDVVESCQSYLKNPKAPKGHIVVFKGSRRTDFNGGYLEEEAVNNIAVRKGGPNEFLVTDRYYYDGDGGERPGLKRRSYTLRLLGPDKIEAAQAKYPRELFVKCQPPLQVVANENGAVSGPSFDCSKARWPDEKTICEDRRLSDLDRLIGSAYTTARDRFGRQINQRVGHFLTKRHQCGSEKLCILDAQLEALRGYSQLGVPTRDH
jgi:hypothetical protein